MGNPNLKGLRRSIGERFSSGQLNTIDNLALLAGLAGMAWLQYAITRPYAPSPLIWERIVIAPISFVLAATSIYTLWYLPQVTIAFLKRYWWTVLLACVGLFVWAGYVSR